MNLRLTQYICLLLIFTSCKSFQRISSRDDSRSATASKKSNSKFLNNISITPGEKKNTDYSYNKPVAQSSKKSFSNTASSFNLEKADWLQIKYAIMMDMPVEQLNNLPLLQQIDHWWGTRYCMGGSNENCIDCSAFTQTMLHNVYGVDVPRTAKEQYDFSAHINDTDIQEGDLVFFKSGHSVTHVGLYIGNYKFVHATTSGGVTISGLNDNYWGKKYAGAGRVIQ
jgi:cell wall-associated NlpC family hydrolase